MGVSSFNELKQRENNPLKEAETIYAIHILQIFLGSPNFNILPFGLARFTTTFLSQGICMTSIRKTNINLILTLNFLINDIILGINCV